MVHEKMIAAPAETIDSITATGEDSTKISEGSFSDEIVVKKDHTEPSGCLL